jgi:hypothetical protein
MTVSKPWLASSCCSVAGKASIEPYLAPTSSAKERRSWMFWRAVSSE